MVKIQSFKKKEIWDSLNRDYITLGSNIGLKPWQTQSDQKDALVSKLHFDTPLS